MTRFSSPIQLRAARTANARPPVPTPVRLPASVGNQASLRRLQPKLEIGAIDDPLEREADAVADKVMRMPDSAPALSRSPRQVGRKCAACEEEGKKKVQLKPASATPALGTAPPVVHDALSAPGRPLDAEARNFFEPRFGFDFGDVRVRSHAAAAQAIGARAFALGRDIVLADAAQAEGDGGRRLLAHELAHVVQQTQGGAEQVQRVPKRDEVGTIYDFSTNCGWIDWHHANPWLMTELIKRVRDASDGLKDPASGAPAAGAPATGAAAAAAPAGQVTTPTMTSRGLGLVIHAAAFQVKLKRALSDAEVVSVSLSLFKTLSIMFETQQRATDWLRESSFAQEDLPSNLIGFYMAAKNYDQPAIRGFCGALSQQDSLKEYDRNHDFVKNHDFTPVGATGPWPKELSTISDAGASDLFVAGKIDVMSSGSVFGLCPLYRLNGTISNSVLPTALGGKSATFVESDDVKVVPTYAAYEKCGPLAGITSHGCEDFIEVTPAQQKDKDAFAKANLSYPRSVSASVLNCLDSAGAPLKK